MDSIRGKYKQFGVKNFYAFHGGEYKNPHEESIRKSIRYIYENWDLNFRKVLDLAAGKGEVTKILQDIGVKDIDAVDGFLANEYEKEVDKNCMSMTFDDISNGYLKYKAYSLIICSYALHLLDYSKLPRFLWAMTEITNDLLVIGPHKRPEIKDTWGWALEKEIVIDRVRSRHFVNTMQAFL